MLRLGLLFGSYRKPANGHRALAFLEKQAADLGFQPFIVDAAAMGLPLLEKTYDEDPENPHLVKLAKLYQTLDAFVLVSGEYNHLPHPGLLNLLNFFTHAYKGRPSGLVTYSVGAFGGCRSEQALRTIADTLGMPSIASVLSLPLIHKTLDEKGDFLNANDILQKNTHNFFSQLADAAKILKKKP